MSKGIGMWLALLAAAGLLVGAILERNESGAVAGASGSVPKRAPTPGDITMMVSGAGLLVFSFFSVLGEGLDGDFEPTSAWGSGLFPLYALPALLGAILAIRVALIAFADVRVPDRILGISWREIDFGFAGWALIMMLSFLIAKFAFEITADDVGLSGDEADLAQGELDDLNDQTDVDKAAGFWLMLISSLGLVAGAYLRSQEREGPAAPPPPVQQQAPPPPPPPA